MPAPREKLSSIRPKSRFDAPGHKPTAPWAKESLGSRSKAAGFVPVCTPRPSQAGHQPKGLLKEKLCGDSGSKLRPHFWQAKC